MGELKIGRESQRQLEVSNDANYDFQAQSSSTLWGKKKEWQYTKDTVKPVLKISLKECVLGIMVITTTVYKLNCDLGLKSSVLTKLGCWTIGIIHIEPTQTVNLLVLPVN